MFAAGAKLTKKILEEEQRRQRQQRKRKGDKGSHGGRKVVLTVLSTTLSEPGNGLVQMIPAKTSSNASAPERKPRKSAPDPTTVLAISSTTGSASSSTSTNTTTSPGGSGASASGWNPDKGRIRSVNAEQFKRMEKNNASASTLFTLEEPEPSSSASQNPAPLGCYYDYHREKETGELVEARLDAVVAHLKEQKGTAILDPIVESLMEKVSKCLADEQLVEAASASTQLAEILKAEKEKGLKQGYETTLHDLDKVRLDCPDRAGDVLDEHAGGDKDLRSLFHNAYKICGSQANRLGLDHNKCDWVMARSTSYWTMTITRIEYEESHGQTLAKQVGIPVLPGEWVMLMWQKFEDDKIWSNGISFKKYRAMDGRDVTICVTGVNLDDERFFRSEDFCSPVGGFFVTPKQGEEKNLTIFSMGSVFSQFDTTELGD